MGLSKDTLTIDAGENSIPKWSLYNLKIKILSKMIYALVFL
jgi:hypothetical protein